MLVEPLLMDTLNRFENPAVKAGTPVMQQFAVRDFVGERVLEGVARRHSPHSTSGARRSLLGNGDTSSRGLEGIQPSV